MKFVSIALFVFAALPAWAQNSTSWVSHSGLDTNPCTFASPCGTFQGAYNKTNVNGIVRAMDAGDFGTITIYKGIAIDGNGVASIDGGISVVNAGVVEIRNLEIHTCGTCLAIQVTSPTVASYVTIENIAINIGAGTGVEVDQGSLATIHNLTVTGAGTGVEVNNSQAIISDSSFRNCNYGIAVYGSSAAATVMIERSKILYNATGLLASANTGISTTVRISDNVIAGNTTAIFNGGQIITFRNNTWAGNTTDGTTPFSASLK